jgi:hypothetical protein
MGQDKRLTNEARHPYIVQFPVDSVAGLNVQLNRSILGFHHSRHIKPQHGRSITEGNQIYCRWCFSDLETARDFVEQRSILQNNWLT